MNTRTVVTIEVEGKVIYRREASEAGETTQHCHANDEQVLGILNDASAPIAGRLKLWMMDKVLDVMERSRSQNKPATPETFSGVSRDD